MTSRDNNRITDNKDESERSCCCGFFARLFRCFQTKCASGEVVPKGKVLVPTEVPTNRESPAQQNISVRVDSQFPTSSRKD